MKKENVEHKIKKIDVQDHRRILLSEVLPYEVPILLTNEGFYKKKQKSKSLIASEILSSKEEKNPFIFKIQKTQHSHRTLYLIHPANQLSFIDFYRNYQDLIPGLTTKSSISLRAPAEVASAYYDQQYVANTQHSLKDEGTENQSDENSSSDYRFTTSFFAYKKYDFLYKFYDSYEFHRLEKKFKKLIKFDIAKCFDSISTKLLGVSLKGVEYQKNNKGKHNFETLFENLMENCNYGKFSGIVIGPEFSRIFAELVLQQADIHALKASREFSGDFEVRRYVDDYFLFYNEDKIGATVLKNFELELEKNKLFLNESKISKHSAPFITGITMAKKDIQDIFGVLFDAFDETKNKKSLNSSDTLDGIQKKYSDENDNIVFIRHFRTAGTIANRLIRDIKSIIKKNNIEFESITGYFFTVIKNKMHEIYDSTELISSEEQENLYKFLQIIIDISFFTYSMDVRVRSTFLVSQISIMCSNIAKTLPVEYSEEILKKLQDEISFSIKNKNSDAISSGVEVCNLLIVLREISDDLDLISESEIIKFATGRENSEQLNINYFQIISLLFYIRNNETHESIKKKIKKSILQKILSMCPTRHSESAHLFLDAMTCPYLDRGFKAYLTSEVSKVMLKRKLKNSELKNEIASLSGSDWFVDWSKVKISKLLQKKELRSPYS